MTIQPPNEFYSQPPQNPYGDLKARLQNKVQAKLPASAIGSQHPDARQAFQAAFESALKEEAIVLSRAERQRLFDQIADDVLGLGPLEPLLQDSEIAEILVDGPDRIYYEKNGKFEDAIRTFRDNAHLLEIIRRILEPLGLKVDESTPFADARLIDGSRIHVAIPPIALNGPSLVIRKFWPPLLTLDDLLKHGVLSQTMLDFLRACVLGRLNIAISGGPGAGKSTILNNLGALIPADERILLLQNAPDVTLLHKRLVVLETRPPNFEGRGEISMSDLVQNALKMRPDRIIVSEARGPEMLDMIQAINAGHNGSLFTLHAHSPRDAVARLEIMVASANPSIPLLAVREQLASALQLIIHLERVRDGSRKVLVISEVEGLQGDAIKLSDIFVFEPAGYENGKVTGRFKATGYAPKLLTTLKSANINLPPGLFTA